ncbi:hypothetical protein [Flavobacterium sp.]|uniref:hypothetical protein n=1 Tax=Flavobacterium sp. TaxID=239 RepID=UPI00286D63CA|nr:hypothetical protein [Flavobacterium sp.]
MKLLKIFFSIFIFSNLSFGQTKSPFLINNELFELPGKWEHLGKIENSGQYSFSNKKLKLGLLISVRKTEIFDFYNKELTEFEFLNKFYIWETEFWGKDDGNVEIEKIEVNETEKYIIWRLKIIDKNIESFILSGVRNSKLIGISLSDNNKKEPKSRTEKIEFIMKIYFKK